MSDAGARALLLNLPRELVSGCVRILRLLFCFQRFGGVVSRLGGRRASCGFASVEGHEFV